MKPRVFLPAIASGVLLWAAFFPLNLGPVAFVALVPWLTLVRAPVSNRRRYFAAYLGGVAFFCLATNWVRVAHPMMHLSWLGLTVVMPLFWVAALALIRQLDRLGLPLALAVPAGWVALEYFRMHFPTGFPFMKHIGAYQMIGFGWYYLGYTQHEFAQLIQIADVGGVYAVSFVVASVNGAVTEVAMRCGAVQRVLCVQKEPTPLTPADPPPSPLPAGRGSKSDSPSLQGGGWGVGFACAFLAMSIGYGFHRLEHEPFADGPLVSAIQGNVPQGEKMSRGGGLIEQYKRVFGIAYTQYPQPDLIVWPETCYWKEWYEVTPGVSRESVPASYRNDLMEADREFRVRWTVPILFGLSGHEWDGSHMWRSNTALLVGPHMQGPMRYDKIHLVPFGEYVPLGEQLPFMKWFTPYPYDYSCRPGEKWTRFPLKAKNGRDYTFACLICYEDSDTYIARQYVAIEPVNFFVNISNDGWFDGTEEHEEHLAICRFRAIETRRSVVRAVNMGISAVIDPDGRVVALPREIIREQDQKGQVQLKLNEQQQRGWLESKKIEGVTTATVPIDSRESHYATLGDWVPAACWLTALVGVIAGFIRKASGGRKPPVQSTGTGGLRPPLAKT